MKVRNQLYKEIEKHRNSKVLSYFTSTREGMGTQIAPDVLPIFTEHLDRIGDVEKISLVLYTNGGDLLAAWSLVNLIKSYCDTLEVIIPANCFSSGTLICLGASNIVMTKQAMLGPIDPSINGLLNPQIPGWPDQSMKAPVSVEFVNAYINMAKNDFGISDQKHMTEIFLGLSEKIHPLVLGQVYRSKSQIRMLANKLLSPLGLSEEQQETIIKFLCSESGSHDYSIRRKEASENLGLPVEKPDRELYNLIKGIYDDAAKEMELNMPFNPVMIWQSGNPQYKCTRGIIESIDYGSDLYLTEGEINIQDIPMPDGSVRQNLSDMKTFEGWKHFNNKP